MNVLVVGQPTDPTSGGAYTLQQAVKHELARQAGAHKFYYSDTTQISSPNIRDLLNNFQIDFIWFLSPFYVQTEIPFAITVWDLAHRVNPGFPEVNYTGWTYEQREAFYQNALPRASFVITGTERGKYEISNAYGVFPENIKIIPFVTTRMEIDAGSEDRIRSNFKWLNRNNVFLLYPAQFWPHKNHMVLLDALRMLLDAGEQIRLVLTGTDKGNKEHVRQYVHKLDLNEYVDFLGFVTTEELIWLYKNAYALVYPSYFGPDNLPPLEAMHHDCPVLVAEFEGMREQLKDAALYFDADDAVDLKKSIEQLENKESIEQIMKNAKKLTESRNPTLYVKLMIEALNLFEKKRRNWSSSYLHL